jgi:selenocysteine lyase/cysteine desulfurase
VQMPEQLPSRYEAGSHNMWAIAGLHAALGWLQETGRTVIVQRTMELAWQLRHRLADAAGVDLFAPPPETPWCGILSFAVSGTTPQAIETALGAQNIAVRAGLHCAPWAHDWLGTQHGGGTVRVSLGHLNTETEIELVCHSLTRLL